MGRFTAAAAVVLTVAAFTIGPTLVQASPSPHLQCAAGYAYAGYASRDGVRGVAATISARKQPSIDTGHAAAWVGVGGIHAGRDGRSEWLQAGVAAFPHAGLRVYVESVSRGAKRRFVDLGPAAVGRRYRIRVAQIAPDIWHATLDGAPVGRPAYLPPERGSWRGVATSESWREGRGTCNRYAFRFENVSVRHAGWTRLRAAEPVGRRVAGDRTAFSAAG